MKNIIYLKGNGDEGKSTFTAAIKIKHGIVCDIIHTDNLVQELLLEHPTETVTQNFIINQNYRHDLFIRSELFDLNKFLEKLFETIKSKPKNLIIIEGYSLIYFFDKIIDELNKKFNKIKIVTTSTHKSNESIKYFINYENEIFETTNKNYDVIFNKIIKDFTKESLNEKYNSIIYQCFDILGYECGNSISPEKYKNSKLDDYIKENDIVLDIGCNTGYFSFKMSEKTNNKIIGIDNHDGSIELCNLLNQKIFNIKNIEFIYNDIFQYNFSDKFNVIFCASVFHYFREKQKFFIDKIYDLLENDGLFVLEVELNPNQGLLKLSRINNEEPCHFPDEKIFFDMIDKKFIVLEKNYSVKQKGSPNHRYFYILKKINN